MDKCSEYCAMQCNHNFTKRLNHLLPKTDNKDLVFDLLVVDTISWMLMLMTEKMIWLWRRRWGHVLVDTLLRKRRRIKKRYRWNTFDLLPATKTINRRISRQGYIAHRCKEKEKEKVNLSQRTRAIFFFKVEEQEISEKPIGKGVLIRRLTLLYVLYCYVLLLLFYVKPFCAPSSHDLVYCYHLDYCYFSLS